MIKKLILYCAIALLMPLYAFSEARDTSKLPAYTDEVLVVYKTEFTQADTDALSAKYQMKETARNDIIRFLETKHNISQTRTYLPKSFFTCYKIQGIENMESIVESLKAEPVIEQAQPNYLFYTQTASYTPLAAPNDPKYKTPQVSQWYINQVRADKVYTDLRSSITPQKNVIVAVIDTGVGTAPNCSHEDLVGVTVTGRDILDNTKQPYDDDGAIMHGTHVAGIIAANTNNSLGIASVSGFYNGVTLGVRIMPVKALDSTGSGTDADIYTGIVWAADNGADIINLSLGAATADNILKTAVNYAYDKGCLLIAAAGNSGTQTFYPAAYSNVIAVAASDMLLDSCGSTYDARAIFWDGSKSNWGKIDIAAPGVNILSTSNGYSLYTTEDGTSFSSPIVAGVAALIKMKYPDYDNDKIKTVLEQTGDDDYHVCSGTITGIQGYDKYFGWGRVNAYRALTLDVNNMSTPEIKTYNWPNPFSPDSDGHTNIVFTLDAPRKTTVSIYDGGGELVWEKILQAAAVSAVSQNVIIWDGRNKDNKKAANGVYFYVVKTDNGKYGKNKIAVLY